MRPIKIAAKGFLAVVWTFFASCLWTLIANGSRDGRILIVFFGFIVMAFTFWGAFCNDLERIIRLFWRNQYGNKEEARVFEGTPRLGFWARLKAK